MANHFRNTLHGLYGLFIFQINPINAALVSMQKNITDFTAQTLKW